MSSEIVNKWGEAVARRGFAQIPNYLLLLNQFLAEESRLSPVELLLLIELVGTWWKVGEMPFPSIKTLSVRCGVSDRQIQRAIGTLEKRGFLKREKRRSTRGIIASNVYNLTPATEFLEDVAKLFPNEFPRKIGQINLINKSAISDDKLLNEPATSDDELQSFIQDILDAETDFKPK